MLWDPPPISESELRDNFILDYLGGDSTELVPRLGRENRELRLKVLELQGLLDEAYRRELERP